jgi:phage terminase small subunit
MALTAKQEAFAQAYIETGNASEAYRRAYDCSRSKPNGIHVSASQLLADPKVALRVAALQANAAERAVLTLEGHLLELASLRDEAKGRGQLAAAIAAEIARGRHGGVIAVERTAVEVTHATDDDARAATIADRLERGAAEATRH